MNHKINDQGLSNRVLVNRNGLDGSSGVKDASMLSEYNFNVDATSIVSSLCRIKEIKWPKPLQSNSHKGITI